MPRDLQHLLDHAVGSHDVRHVGKPPSWRASAGRGGAQQDRGDREQPPAVMRHGGILAWRALTTSRQRAAGRLARPMLRPTCDGRGTASWTAWIDARRSRTVGAIGAARRVAWLTWSDISSLVAAR